MNFPILSAIIFIPLVGSLFILVIKGEQKTVVKNSKYVAIFSSLANFILSIFLWYSFDVSTSEFQFVEEKNWMKGFINYQLGIDGISILFILLYHIYSTHMYFFQAFIVSSLRLKNF